MNRNSLLRTPGHEGPWVLLHRESPAVAHSLSGRILRGPVLQNSDGQRPLFTIKTTGQWMISITIAVAKNCRFCEKKNASPLAIFMWFSMEQLFGSVIS